ncbi:MAG: radical SAM protein [Lachnospiraceae bacterium]|nr:radical SAM protein [Lachnospiraceae bacterium]
MSKTIKILGINRHRLKTDGKGVTTLVALPGCPLRCEYCINKEFLQQTERLQEVTIEKLIEKLSDDHCYFVYTGGGVTFGGGEPLLQMESIVSFLNECPEEWNLTIETSLNVPYVHESLLQSERVSFIIDIKSMNKDIYERYTGKSQEQTIHNLKEIAKQVAGERYYVRLPRIPGYTTKVHIDESIEALCALGINKNNIQIFDYVVE